MSIYGIVVTPLIIAFSFVIQTVQGQYQHFKKQLRNNAISLDSTSLISGSPLPLPHTLDLNFKVLAIGEQYHGTSEFFKARISLIKSLASNGMLTKIGLEAPIAEVDKLNSYILLSY